jgi:hypothetical protein
MTLQPRTAAPPAPFTPPPARAAQAPHMPFRGEEADQRRQEDAFGPHLVAAAICKGVTRILVEQAGYTEPQAADACRLAIQNAADDPKAILTTRIIAHLVFTQDILRGSQKIGDQVLRQQEDVIKRLLGVVARAHTVLDEGHSMAAGNILLAALKEFHPDYQADGT